MSDKIQYLVRDMINKFSLIKGLVDTLMASSLDKIIEACNQEENLLPFIDPTAYMKTNNNFYDEIKDITRILKEIKDFELHVYVK